MVTEVIPVPTLSAKGWVDSLPEKADVLISHFFASDAFQSSLYAGEIANLQVLIQQYMHDIDGLKQGLRNSLEKYLGRYYSEVTVDIADDTAVNPSNRISLMLNCMVVEKGRSYSFANLLSLVDSKFEKITKLNNTGKIT
jgi:hypothetical protein